MGRIIVPGEDSASFAKDINRVVKQHREGKSRPFLTIVVDNAANGDATVLSNMDIREQRIKLLEQVLRGLKGN